MSNFASAIREEVVRLARKELKKENAVLRKASAQYRRDIASLKRTVSSLEKKVAILNKKVLAKPLREEKVSTDKPVRFSPKGLQSHREKLGLSAADYAALAGVSPLSIYNWEKGKTRPRKEQIAILAALRGISKKEATARLAALAGK